MLKLGQLHEEAREISAGVTADNSQLRSLSRRLLGALERGHGDFEATEVSQLFSLCEDLDSNRRFKIRDPVVAEIVSDARK